MSAFPARPLRVFLLDDHDLVRRGVRDLLSASRDITVVGESSYARNAVDLILHHKPDVMALDLHLQDGNGVHVCREVRAVEPAIAGLLLTASTDDEAALAAVLGGAAAFTTKFAHSTDLIGVIRAIGARRSLIDDQLRAQVTGRFTEVMNGLRPSVDESARRTAELALEGRTDTEIAALTELDLLTVRSLLADVISRTTGLLSDPLRVDESGGRHRRDLQ